MVSPELFRPLLAATLLERDLPNLKFPLYGSPKLDGVRGLVRDGKIVSRKLIRIPNLFTQQMFDLPSLEGVDGELIVGSPTALNVCRQTYSSLMRHKGEPDVNLYIFDRVSTDTYLKRYETLRGIYHPNVILVDTVELKSVEELLAYELSCLEQGYEGIMLRSATGLYKYGRSTLSQMYLLKFKRFSDDEAQIIGFNERMHNSNEASKDDLGHTKRASYKANMVPMNTLGSLQVRMRDGREFSVRGSIDDDLGTVIWANREEYLGKWIKFKYFNIGVKDLPRFPVFLGFRDIEVDG